MNDKTKKRPKMENTTILGDFPLKYLHMRRIREIIIHADSLSNNGYPFTFLDPNNGYPFTSFLLNSTTLETNKALESKVEA